MKADYRSSVDKEHGRLVGELGRVIDGYYDMISSRYKGLVRRPGLVEQRSIVFEIGGYEFARPLCLIEVPQRKREAYGFWGNFNFKGRGDGMYSRGKENALVWITHTGLLMQTGAINRVVHQRYPVNLLNAFTDAYIYLRTVSLEESGLGGVPLIRMFVDNLSNAIMELGCPHYNEYTGLFGHAMGKFGLASFNNLIEPNDALTGQVTDRQNTSLTRYIDLYRASGLDSNVVTSDLFGE